MLNDKTIKEKSSEYTAQRKTQTYLDYVRHHISEFLEKDIAERAYQDGFQDGFNDCLKTYGKE